MSSAFKVHEYVAHTTEVVSLAISPKTGQVLATGGEDCKVNIWDVKTAGNIRSLGSNKAGVESLCFDPDDTIVVSGSASGALKVFDLNEGRLSRNLVGHKTNITSLQYHPISEYVVSGSKDCNVKVWDVRNKDCLSTYTGHEKEVTCVRFSPDGRWVASSAKDGTILIWDMVAGKHLQTLKVNPSFVTTFEFNPNEFLLAAVTNAKAVKVWNLENMEVAFTTPAEQHAVKALSFAPSKPVLCTATKDAVKSWTWEGEAIDNGNGGSGGPRSLTLAGVKHMGADGVPISALRISKSGNVTGSSCISNFVSIYRTSLDAMVASQAEVVADKESRGAAHSEGDIRLAARPPFALYGNPGASPGEKGRGGAGVERSNVNVQSPSLYRELNKPERDRGGTPQSPPLYRNISGDAERIRADREKYKGSSNGGGSNGGTSSGSRERVVDRNDDWSAAEPKQSSPPQAAGGGRGHKSVSPESYGAGVRPGGVDRPQSKGSPPAYLFAPAEAGAGAGAAAEKGNYDDRYRSSKDDGFKGEEQRLEARLPGPAGSRFSRLPTDPAPAPRIDSPIDLSVPMSLSPPSTRSPARSPRSSIVNNNEDPAESGVDDGGRRPASAAPALGSPVGRPGRGGPASAPKPKASNEGPSTSSTSQETLLASLDSALRTSRPFSSSLSKRLVDVRVLRKFWNRGDLEDVIDHLDTIKEAAKHDSLHLVVLADFFSNIELVGNGLCLDSCLRLLPLIEEMLSYTQKSRDLGSSGSLAPACSHIVSASLKAFNSLIGAFGELISDTCASHETSASAGVDLSREARFKKCKVCLDVMRSVRKRIPAIKEQFRDDELTLKKLTTLQSTLVRFM